MKRATKKELREALQEYEEMIVMRRCLRLRMARVLRSRGYGLRDLKHMSDSKLARIALTELERNG